MVHGSSDMARWLGNSPVHAASSSSSLPSSKQRGSGNMLSSDIRMAPRPAKSAAWSHGLLPSPVVDDPSSCSDNASDNSDKMENYCQSQSQGSKARKRKIIGNGGPSFVSSGGGVAPDGVNRGPHDHMPIKNDSGEARNSIGQAGLWTDAELAADFDGSLSGLGADLSASSYDMSEALLALPTIYQQRAAAAAATQQQNQNSISGFLKGDTSGSVMPPLGTSHVHGSSASLSGDFHFDNQPQPNSCQQSGSTSGSHPPQQDTMHLDCERRFQYVLAAATSVATKVNEETLTYLNQCQPYEIKLKKLGELTAYRGVVFRSTIRLCFHDRRLQFAEREQLALWEIANPNDRIMQVDLPLSYGVTLLSGQGDNTASNTISFLWEPLKEVGLYIKINCISTEFTPKKHGGEKGVPFRLLIETHSHPENIRLHAAACQIKVFKLKGADRKHKQDREKIMKKTIGEQAKLQPSYDCTVLSDVSLESLDSPPPQAVQNNQSHQALLSPSYNSDHPIADSPENNSNSGNGTNTNNQNVQTTTSSGGGPTSFSAHFSPESVRRWLIRNRFSATKTLWDFSGVDLLRLGKEELIEICGLPEGIRLYNALHFKITFYILLSNAAKDGNQDQNGMKDGETVYHPICLSAASISEMTSVIASLFYSQFSNDSIPVERLLLSVLAPGGSSRIRALLTEQLLSTLKDQTAFKATKRGNEVDLEIVEG